MFLQKSDLPTYDLVILHPSGPPFQFNIGAIYFKPVAHDWALELSADVNYHDARVDFDDDLARTPSYTVTNVGARFFQPSGPGGVSIICTNCTDERYVARTSQRVFGKVTPTSLDLVARAGLPRLITLQVSYSFDRK